MTATDRYLIKCAVCAGPSAEVLDFGCGDGRFLEMLLERGVNARGVDIPSSRAGVERRDAAKPELGLAARVRYVAAEDVIPLEDDSVDVLVSNTVFEHLIALDLLLGEMARVLRPGGMIYTVFPLGSCLVEQHCGLPLFHIIESRRFRLAYLRFAKMIGLYRKAAAPAAMEAYCYENTFYRRENEIQKLFRRHFSIVESDTQTYLRTAGESWTSARSPLKRLIGRWLSRAGARLARFVHIRYAAAYRLAEPRKQRASTTV